jgi:hypothetical protein
MQKKTIEDIINIATQKFINVICDNNTIENIKYILKEELKKIGMVNNYHLDVSFNNSIVTVQVKPFSGQPTYFKLDKYILYSHNFAIVSKNKHKCINCGLEVFEWENELYSEKEPLSCSEYIVKDILD